MSPTYQLGIELREHYTGGSHPEWTEQLVDHTMDMMQGEDMKDHIVFSPCPLVDQPCHLQENSTTSDRGKPLCEGRNAAGASPAERRSGERKLILCHCTFNGTYRR